MFNEHELKKITSNDLTFYFYCLPRTKKYKFFQYKLLSFILSERLTLVEPFSGFPAAIFKAIKTFLPNDRGVSAANIDMCTFIEKLR